MKKGAVDEEIFLSQCFCTDYQSKLDDLHFLIQKQTQMRERLSEDQAGKIIEPDTLDDCELALTYVENGCQRLSQYLAELGDASCCHMSVHKVKTNQQKKLLDQKLGTIQLEIKEDNKKAKELFNDLENIENEAI